MAPVTNGRVLFNEVPEDYPIPGKTTVYDTSEKFDVDALELKENSVAVKLLAFSIDPYLRGRMRSPNAKSYSPPFTLGEPIAGEGVGVIVKSTHSTFTTGSHVFGSFPFAEYAVKENPKVGGWGGLHLLQNDQNLPWTDYLGVLGMPGRTAYYGWKEHSHAKKGQTAFVTTGAGPVGSLVIQLAKRDGLKVIASAGSDDKVEFMKSIGADVAFNYKTKDTNEVLEKEGPIDVYWDNVGGSSLDAALEHSALFGHFIECGMITEYNEGKGSHMKNLRHIVSKRLTIHGLLIWDLEEKYGKEFVKDLPKLIASGEIKHRDEITKGLDKTGDVILAVQKGYNTAKAVISVA